MSAPDRYAANACSVFSLAGTAHIADLENATVKFNAKHEDGSGIADDYTYPLPTKGDWDIEADLFYTQGNSAILNIISTSVAVVFTVGPKTYSGNALASTGTHTAHRDNLQKVKITLMVQGSPSLS